MIGAYFKSIEFLLWKSIDFKRWFQRDPYIFDEYGVSVYCGRQGAGKTISLVEYLERIRKKYPKVVIVTNFNYKHQTYALHSWNDLVDIRNDEYGVIFALDEIQNEFDCNSWRDFPDWLLKEVTQQRKQKIKIVLTSQIYSRIVKQLREQCYEVIECFTLWGRWTFTKCYDAFDYNATIDSPSSKKTISHNWRYSFIQSDQLRDLYNTHEKIETIKKVVPLKVVNK